MPRLRKQFAFNLVDKCDDCDFPILNIPSLSRNIAASHA
jgi:hypothetical protein